MNFLQFYAIGPGIRGGQERAESRIRNTVRKKHTQDYFFSSHLLQVI
jgi:hypothetical protein